MDQQEHERRIANRHRLIQERRGAVRGKPERSFLSLLELSREQMAQLIDGGIEAKRSPDRFARCLAGKSVGLLFQKTSTRTRASFEIGVGEMGGQPMFIDWKTSNFTLGALEDEAKVLSRYVDLLMARVYKHEDLVTMKGSSEVPVINGLCNLYHPCQGLTDFMTIKEYFGGLEGLKLAYVGDGNNVCHSLVNGAALTGLNISIAHPEGYAPNVDILGQASHRSEGKSVIELTNDPAEAVLDADVVYTDTWISMGDEAQQETRLKAFDGFQVDRALMDKAWDHAIVMHCLPAHRGYEISDGVMDSEGSVVYDQAENRKHAQKYLMAWMMEALP